MELLATNGFAQHVWKRGVHGGLKEAAEYGHICVYAPQLQIHGIIRKDLPGEDHFLGPLVKTAHSWGSRMPPLRHEAATIVSRTLTCRS
jgi:hypothetical protein